jgi:hypothetical protein
LLRWRDAKGEEDLRRRRGFVDLGMVFMGVVVVYTWVYGLCAHERPKEIHACSDVTLPQLGRDRLCEDEVIISRDLDCQPAGYSRTDTTNIGSIEQSMLSVRLIAKSQRELVIEILDSSSALTPQAVP